MLPGANPGHSGPGWPPWATPRAQGATVGPHFASGRLPLHKLPHVNEHTKRTFCAQTTRETGLKCPGFIQLVLHCHMVHCHVAGVAKNGHLAFFLGIFDGFHVSVGHCCAVQSVLSRVHRCLIQMLTTSPGSCFEPGFECSWVCNRAILVWVGHPKCSKPHKGAHFP